MKVYQVIFTYRKRGILPERTLQAAVKSCGAPEDDIKEIESRLSLLKDDEDISNMLCISPAYSYFILKSGRYCICMSRCMDNTIDSFYCHSLIVEEGGMSFYPVQLIDSPVFKNDWDGEDSKPLPILDSGSLSMGISFEDVSKFVRPRLKQGIQEILSAAAKYKDVQKPILIRDNPDNLHLWLAAVQMAFPVEIAHRATFASFPVSGEGCMFVCSSTNYSTAFEYERGPFIFDYYDGIITAPEVADFTRIVCMGYLTSKATLESFHHFLMQFNFNEIDDSLDDCYSLYIIFNLHGAKTENIDIKKGFRFALDYGRQDIFEDIFQVIEPSIDSIVRILDEEAAEVFVRFIFITAMESKKLILTERVCTIFYSILDHLVIDCKPQKIDSIIRFYNDMAEFSRDKIHSFHRYAISKERIGYLYDVLSKECTPGAAEFFLIVTFRSLSELGYLWNQALVIEKMGVFMDFCISSICEMGGDPVLVLDSVEDINEFLPRVIMLFYNRIKSYSENEKLVEKFISVMDKKEDNDAFDIRRKIYNMEGGKLLFEEYVQRLKCAADKTQYFNDFCRKVFDNINGFAHGYFSDAVKSYFDELPREKRHEEGIRMLKDLLNNNVTLNDAGAAAVIKGFEEGLAFKEPSAELKELIPQVKRLKKNRNISTFPDMTGFVDFMLWTENGDISISVDEIMEGFPDIERLDKLRYSEYLNWCLPSVVRFIKSPEDHKKVVHMFSKEGCDEEFFSDYLKSMEAVIDEERFLGAEIFLNFEVYYLFYLEPKYRVLEKEKLLGLVRDIVKDILQKQPRYFIEQIDIGIKKEFEGRGLSVPVLWKQMYHEITTRKKTSLLNLIKDIFIK